MTTRTSFATLLERFFTQRLMHQRPGQRTRLPRTRHIQDVAAIRAQAIEESAVGIGFGGHQCAAGDGVPGPTWS